MKEYNIGDKVFWATYGIKNIDVKCPVCSGNKKIDVILGNEERVIIPCEYCSKGFQEPSGWVNEYQYVSDIRIIEITGKEVNETSTGREVRYRYENYILDGQIFETKEEAEAKVLEMIKKQEIENEKRNKNIKSLDIKKSSWHVGYHQKQIKYLKQKLAWHEKKVIEYKSL